MSDPNYRGTLSAYAKWAGITLNAAIKRNKRGRIKFCYDFIKNYLQVRQFITHVDHSQFILTKIVFVQIV